MISFLPPRAYTDNYPPPFCRMLPTAWGAKGGFQRPLAARVQTRLDTRSGRSALALIFLLLQQRRLGGSARALLPDYRCPALVEPFVWAGCDITFYLLQTNLPPTLYPTLRAGKVPHVFPFLLNDAADFSELRHAGVPLYRREELAEPLSDISHHYRAHLVQLPCHQALTQENLATICRVVNSTRCAAGARS